MEKSSGRKRVALVLSATESEIYGKYRTADLAGHLDAKGSYQDRCYLCRRLDGEKGIALQNDPDSPVVFTTVQLSRYRVDLLDGFALEYLLCFECAALISAFEVCGTPEPPIDLPD